MSQASTRRSAALVIGAAVGGIVFGALGGVVIGKAVLPPYENDNTPPGGRPTSPGAHLITPDTKLSDLNEVERERLLDAMQRQEGWRPGTTSYRGNNPGNINQGQWARAHGSIGDIHGIAIFPDYKTGRDTMRTLVFDVYGDRTIYGMLAGDPAHGIKGYAPAVVDQFGRTGNPSLYAQHVATWMNEAVAQGKSSVVTLSRPPHSRPNARSIPPTSKTTYKEPTSDRVVFGSVRTR
jgi:hypothetical protein